MPNYNINDLTIRGTKGNVKKFLKAYIDPDTNEFDFNRVIPEPLVKEDCPIDCIATVDSHIQQDVGRPWFDWYSWHNRFWGTKWNAWDTYCNDIDKSFPDTDDDEEIEFIFGFTTAWCPPMPIFEKICEDWHDILDITCFYIEEGMGFCGTYDYEYGDYCCEGGPDDPEYRQCTIDNDYYDQEYWDEYDEEYGNEED